MTAAKWGYEASILVTGATGQVGRQLVDELRPAWPSLRVLVRNPAQAQALSDGGLEVALGSYDDPESLRRAFAGIRRLFLLSPAGTESMVSQQTNVLEAAVAAGVDYVVKLSSIGAEEQTGATIIDAHRHIEEEIERSALAWTHLRPNWFMQNELGQAVAVARDGVFYAPDVTTVSMIDVRDIAAVAAKVLTQEGHEGRAYVLTGPEALSYADLAERYTSLLSRKVRWQEVTLEEVHAALLTDGLPEVLAQGFTEIMARYREGGTTASVSPDTLRLLGRSPRTFERFLADHRAAFGFAAHARA